MLSDSDNFLALSREYSMIKTTGEHLTNVINGSVHGIMKNEWTSAEVLNFGELLFYYHTRSILKVFSSAENLASLCLQDRPRSGTIITQRPTQPATQRLHWNLLSHIWHPLNPLLPFPSPYPHPTPLWTPPLRNTLKKCIDQQLFWTKLL